MKKILLLLALVSSAVTVAVAQVKGPFVDKIYFDVKMQEDIGLKDAAEGKTDIFYFGANGPAFVALPNDIKAKMEVYSVPSQYWSLALNPYPNRAPYTGVVNGKTEFNPFAIREVRFALNFLINRKQLVDEILVGTGGPMYTPVMPGQPNSARYDLIANKMGMTPSGNERKAIADIEAAMQAAAALPENKGKLVKSGQFWNYAGSPVTVKLLIRVDDPNGRLKEGRYIADQIEKAGIRVERLEYDRSKAITTAYYTDPKDLQWHMYTEGWIGGQTYAFWDVPIAQMYAPWYANMPGNNTEGYWSFSNPEADTLTQNAVNGKFVKPEEYYDMLYKTTELGLKDAVRIFTAYQVAYYAANKARFNDRMAYGIGDGLNKYSLYTANVKPVNGQRTLRVSNFSARGALFASAWDPIGTDGFNDIYSAGMARALTDFEGEADTVTGLYRSARMRWKNVNTDISKDANGNILGQIKVPANAVLWNARTQKWESGLVYKDVKGDGTTYDYVATKDITAYSTGTYTYNGGNWHHGRPVSNADFIYVLARSFDLSVKKAVDDKLYEESYAATRNPALAVIKGWLVNNDGSITTYFDINYPMDKEYLANQGSPTINMQAVNQGIAVCWEINEALVKLVTEGAVSKTVYSFSTDENFTEVDVLNPKHVADIKAKLQDFIAKRYVPEAIKTYVKPDDAVAGYRQAIAFIDKYGHAYISNGGFYLEKYDPANNSAILAANRDARYPYAQGHHARLLATNFARIDSLAVPAYERGKDLKISMTVSTVAFPANTSRLSAQGNIRITLVADTESVYTAKAVPGKTGSFEVIIPNADLIRLKPGSYSLIVEAAIAAETPVVETTSLFVF